MSISRKEAKEILEPYQQLLSTAIIAGFLDYFRLLNHIPRPLKTRTIANLVYDFIEAHAKNNLSGQTGVTLLTLDGLFIAIIQDKLVLRFKKFNSNKMPSNIQTKQTVNYMNQGLDLPNFPDHTSLIVGYELDGLNTKVKEITVTCPNGDSNLWSFNLDGYYGAEIVELPISILPSSTPDIPMKAKEQKEKREKRINE